MKIKQKIEKVTGKYLKTPIMQKKMRLEIFRFILREKKIINQNQLNQNIN